ncbi:MAG: SpoIIE family protein phosphatase, partial [bacterium]
VTHQGNELRLTKVRERVERARPMMFWENLTLRTKFSLLTSLILTLLVFAAFIFFNSRIRSNVTDEMYSKGQAYSSNLAKNSWEPINEGSDLTLYENAQSIWESDSQMIAMVLITDSRSRPLATYPINRNLVGQPLDIPTFQLLDTLGASKIYSYYLGKDSSFYAFISPVMLPGVVNQSIGFSQIWVKTTYVEQRVYRSRINLIVVLFIILILGNGGSFILITRIMDPFHKLASWVRDVGHGNVDEDELDIDASDELGEIAQAFNEMTSKFREAQTNLMEQQRIQRELQVAQEIQQMLLPNDFPNVVGYDITSYYQAAKEVGGDLFDFVEVDDHTIGICVADVSGKGVPGSMVMTMIRTALRLEARGNKNPAEVLSKVNEFVTDDIRKGMFVTAFYLILDSRERMISFASAGHNPMILYRGKSKETYYLNPPGFPVGITLPDINLFKNTIRADRIRLHPDDILICYTDGITEAMNHQRQLYGDERFLAAIRKNGQLDVVECVSNIKQDISNFSGGYEQSDDITLVAVKENMEAVDVKIDMFKDLFELAEKNDTTILQACKDMDVSPSTYYKYKKIYEEGGYDYLREMLHGYTNVGLRHLSIEIKTKLYDIIREHPEYGPKRISDELLTEKYSFVEINPRLIYEELKRAKLNHRKQRERFVQRGGKRRLKPPGTPLLTLDGEVMVGGYRSEEFDTIPKVFAPQQVARTGGLKEKLISVKSNKNGNQSSNNSDESDENADSSNDVKITSDREPTDDNINIIPEEADKK